MTIGKDGGLFVRVFQLFNLAGELEEDRSEVSARFSTIVQHDPFVCSKDSLTDCDSAIFPSGALVILISVSLL